MDPLQECLAHACLADSCRARCEKQQHANAAGIQRTAVLQEGPGQRSCDLCAVSCKLANAACQQDNAADAGGFHAQSGCKSGDGQLADASHARSQRRLSGRQDQRREDQHGYVGCDSATGHERPGPVNGHWRKADWIWCRDGKWRAVEPGAFPLAHGVANRVGRLRA